MLPRWTFSLLLLAACTTASAADWIHWRGPEQNGFSREKNLPDSFDPAKGKDGNVVWKQPYGGRSAPLVMDGRIYIAQGTGKGVNEGERVVCFEEATGKPLWEYKYNVFHTDIVSARLGWAPLTADPATGYVYVHSTGGNLLCLDKGGKLVWQRQLTEEYGRVTGYGGRIPGPVFDSGLVIVSMVCSPWGDFARGNNRFVAFDGKTGEVVWWHDPGYSIKDTFYSTPVIGVINGQRLCVVGGADGYLHALKVRTGERVWSYQYCSGAINPAPIIDGNLVYCAHGDDNPEGGQYGRLICVDASQVDPKTKKPKLVWEFKKSVRFGLASPALADGRLYIPDDTGDLYCFEAKTGKPKGSNTVAPLWKYRYAKEVRSSPLIADGKIYISDVQNKFQILKINGDEKPDELEAFEYRFREKDPAYGESNGTVIAVNGRLYFNSGGNLFCVGTPDAKPSDVKYAPMPEEAKFEEGAIAGIRLSPAEVVVKPGGTAKLAVVFVDKNGRTVKGDGKAEWSLPPPPKTPAGAQPPALAGKIEEGTLTVGPNPAQQGIVTAKIGDWTARARVRVAPQMPFKQDFEKSPEGSSPGGWVNTNGKFVVKKAGDGNLALSKVNTDSRPPIARANGYITLPDAADYTIQADLMATEVRGKLPDFGVVNSRYTLIIDGKVDAGKRSVRLVSWENRPRINLSADFDWKGGEWYTAKLSVEPKEKTATVRGKVWKKGDKEPEKWLFEFEDTLPNRNGAAGVYGYVSNISANDDGTVLPGSDIFYDNITITPNKK